MSNRLHCLVFGLLGLLSLCADTCLGATNEPGALLWHETTRAATGAWGRMSQLTNGDWVLVTTRFSRGEPSALQLLNSSDHCRTWTNSSEVRASGRKLDNGNLLTLLDGHLLLSGRSLVDGESYRLPVYLSEDAGKNWRLLGNIDFNEGKPGTLKDQGLWEPYLFLLPDGRVAAIYSSEIHKGFSQVLSERVSADGGRTWGTEIRVVAEPGGGKLRPGMGVPARLRDGRFILVYEVVGIGRGEVRYKLSRDGINWPVGLGKAIADQEAAPAMTILSDGRLVVTSCSRKFSVSEDGGTTWCAGATPWGNDFKYVWPGLYAIGTNQIVAISSERRGVTLDFGEIEK